MRWDGRLPNQGSGKAKISKPARVSRHNTRYKYNTIVSWGYHVFEPLKEALSGKRFGTVQETKGYVHRWLQYQSGVLFFPWGNPDISESLGDLRSEDYVEKFPSVVCTFCLRKKNTVTFWLILVFVRLSKFSIRFLISSKSTKHFVLANLPHLPLLWLEYLVYPATISFTLNLTNGL